jgi:uncharacterized protein (TIGR03437 family)
VAKVAASGDRLLWSVPIAGDGADTVRAIAIGIDGNPVIAGETTSTNLSLPGAYQATPASLFLAKLSADGGAVLAGTYFGGEGMLRPLPGYSRDRVAIIRVDLSGNVHIGGSAYSYPFPTTPGVVQPERRPFAGGGACESAADHFVAAFDASLRRLLFSTLSGRQGWDGSFNFEVGRDGSLYLAASTIGVVCTAQVTLTRLAPGGTRVMYSQVLSLNNNQIVSRNALAVDSAGNAYAGATSITNSLFPGRAFVWKLDPAGQVLASDAFAGTVSDFAVAPGQVALLGLTRTSIFTGSSGSPRSCYGGLDPRTDIPFVARLEPSTLKSVYEGLLNGGPAWLDAAGQVLVSRPYSSAAGFKVIDAAPPPAGTITCIASAASYNGQWISPGQISSLFGNFIGPSSPAGAQLDSNGNVTTALAGVRVLVNGIPAPLLYAAPDQINFVAPFRTPESGTVRIEIERDGQPLSGIEKAAAPTFPGLFTADATGRGPLAALNQDGSVNSATNPSRPGTLISIFATGFGAMSPAAADGSRPPLPFNSPLAPVFADVEGVSAAIRYAGNAPTLVEGALQINLQLPDAVRFSDTVIRVQVGAPTGVAASGIVFVQ